MNRDELFAQLEKLSPKEIQTRLSSWDKEELVLVHEFLKQKQSKEAQSDQLVKAPTEVSWAAMERQRGRTIWPPSPLSSR